MECSEGSGTLANRRPRATRRTDPPGVWSVPVVGVGFVSWEGAGVAAVARS